MKYRYIIVVVLIVRSLVDALGQRSKKSRVVKPDIAQVVKD